MQLNNVRALRGPNRWARHAVLEAEVDLGDLNGRLSSQIAGFVDRVSAWLPSLGQEMAEASTESSDHRQFSERLRSGVHLADVLVQVAAELERLTGVQVASCTKRAIHEPRFYRIAFGCDEKSLACRIDVPGLARDDRAHLSG